MKKINIVTTTVFILLLFFLTTTLVFAQEDNHTAREEREGKEIWTKLQNKEIACDKLKEAEFEALGEYFMGQAAGEKHEGMNQMMTAMMGEAGEKEMHAVMGKRMSGCDTNANVSNETLGQMGSMFSMMKMMGLKGGGWPMMGGYSGMMGDQFGLWQILAPITWILLLAFLILGSIYFWKEINKKK